MRQDLFQEGHWQCIMDVIKSRLTRASRALDIAVAQITFMNGIMSGMVYDWATVLADRMEEFMTLPICHTMLLGFFLEATLHQILVDEFEVPPRGRLALGESPILYCRHLDTSSTIASQKRVM